MYNSDIILNTSKMKMYHTIHEIGASLSLSSEFIDEIWSGIALNEGLYDEFLYYISNKELLGTFSYEGFTLFDIYFYELRRFNLSHDIGKNPTSCDKDEIVFRSFHSMVGFLKDPISFKDKYSKGFGMDLL